MDIINRIWFSLMYLGKPPWDTGITPPEVMEFIGIHPAGRALDLGCGTGTNAITLTQHGWQVVGVDFAGKAIGNARRKAQQAGLEIDFRQGDVASLDGITGPFDLILDIGCFHSLPSASRAKYAANLPNLLAPAGTFLLYAWLQIEGESGSGIGERELELITGRDQGSVKMESGGRLRLAARQDGTDRRARPSAWFTFQNSHDTPGSPPA